MRLSDIRIKTAVRSVFAIISKIFDDFISEPVKKNKYSIKYIYEENQVWVGISIQTNSFEVYLRITDEDAEKKEGFQFFVRFPGPKIKKNFI